MLLVLLLPSAPPVAVAAPLVEAVELVTSEVAGPPLVEPPLALVTVPSVLGGTQPSPGSWHANTPTAPPKSPARTESRITVDVTAPRVSPSGAAPQCVSVSA